MVIPSTCENEMGATSAPKQTQSSIKAAEIDIIDIRHDAVEISIKDSILGLLRPASGPKNLPTLLLYNEQGLKLFEEITYLKEYYLTNAEIDVLERSADEITKAIKPDSMIIELGSGNLRKILVLLRALEAAGKSVDYYALDLSLTELRRTLEQVPTFKHVRCHGLHGTYDDGLDWLKLSDNRSKPKCIMSLGSSIGNFHRRDAASFLRGFADALGPLDSLLVAIDATIDAAKVYHAYNDREGTTHKFLLNGLRHANEILGETVFNTDDWKVIGEYIYDIAGGRHQAFYFPTKDVHYKDICIKAGERVQIEQSLKYSPEEAQHLWKSSGLIEASRWSASSDAYNVHFLTKMTFNTDPAVYASNTTPTLEDWEGLWAVWDRVTQKMIPNEELSNKPIKLRNACIFYLGHIPTFLEMQLSKTTDLSPCEPFYYRKIFERGIDPDVDDPSQCHVHSEIPDEWPPLQEILGYQREVRAKVANILATQSISRETGRALWLGFEHEIMHLETLLYILLQSDKTIPPTADTPDFERNAKAAVAARVPNDWFEIPEQTFTIGLDDPEDNSGPDNYFGWDNEKPPRRVTVPSFKAQGRPITNEEYAQYLKQTPNLDIPASWVERNSAVVSARIVNGHQNGNSHEPVPFSNAYLDGKFVRTVYGLVPLEHALDWPVFASYNELAGCAKWMGGRIPTFEEARSIYKYADELKVQEAGRYRGKEVPAVNGHLINEGVEETPPSRGSFTGESSQELFTDLAGANVGFKHWNPVAVTGNGNRLAGQSDMGGVWEWTSSPLAKYEGFEPMKLYPAYTADFFDDKHNVMLGGSWATHPRIAGRKTFVNWYQRNYPYAWAGARLVQNL
ncbi:C-type lectin protein [Calycina marina]|uniref:C-type lectin protein n=1 Tax=Calycina marina TaxID=1763456 RepID=A0A9P8CFZ6_9HELO|nr:C-type lectin protein [Calycina marina]